MLSRDDMFHLAPPGGASVIGRPEVMTRSESRPGDVRRRSVSQLCPLSAHMPVAGALSKGAIAQGVADLIGATAQIPRMHVFARGQNA